MTILVALAGTFTLGLFAGLALAAVIVFWDHTRRR